MITSRVEKAFEFFKEFCSLEIALQILSEKKENKDVNIALSNRFYCDNISIVKTTEENADKNPIVLFRLVDKITESVLYIPTKDMNIEDLIKIITEL